MYGRSRPVVPRYGHTLVVGIVARISGGPNQKEVSLDDQQDHARQVVRQLYDGPAEFRVVATTAKGERLDRPELDEIEALLRSGELDLLVCEDLGRLIRGTEACRLCGVAVDDGVRVLASNDGVDTAEDDWEADVISAGRDHVGHNAHTSKRLKQKLMNRFVKFGGATARPVYGYVVPDGARTYDDWAKDPDAAAVYREWFDRLRDDPNCSAVADWLNARGVPTGPYARRPTWDGKMVRRLTANTLLKGTPGRGFKRTVKHHGTGRRVPVRNPDGPAYWDCPHLAHLDPAVWDEVNARLTAANRGFGRKPVGGADPRARVPKKRTRFPGQHARCWYCGRAYVWGGNGVAGNLMCPAAQGGGCWNSVGFSGAVAADRVAAAVAAELARLDGFDAQFRRLVEDGGRAGGADADRGRAGLIRRESDLARQKENLLAAVAAYGPKPMLADKLAEVERAAADLARLRREADRDRGRPPDLPGSAAGLRARFEAAVAGLAADPPEFGAVLNWVVRGSTSTSSACATAGTPCPGPGPSSTWPGSPRTPAGWPGSGTC